MSANTIIIMRKVKNGYQITFKDLEKALKYAKEIQDSGNVEYGIFIKSL